MRIAPVVIALAAAAGCSLHEVKKNPPPPVTVPTSYDAESSARPMPEAWWLDFGDEDLNKLVARSLGDNLKVRAAWARLEQARLSSRLAWSARWPQMTFDASNGRIQRRNFFGEDIELPPGAPKPPETLQNNTYDLSVGVSYEVDLWRRVASESDAAMNDALAVRDDVEAISISLAAQVAEAWFNVVLQRAIRKLLADQLHTNETYLELVELRYQQGLARALDVFQQQQQLSSTRARLALTDASLSVQLHLLAVLVGEPPSAVVAGDLSELPELPPLPGTGVPADLLERRPDVRAARRRVEAADYRVAAAVADRLPSLRLTASGGQQDRTIVDLIGAPVYSVLSALSQPLFDGGRRKAEVERTKAVVQERLMQYGDVLLQAMMEVENALVQERQQLVNIGDLEQQLEFSRSALREARARYREGVSDYLPVLTSLQAQQQVELAVLQAERQRLSFRIQLCRSLGGSWTRKLKSPEREARK